MSELFRANIAAMRGYIPGEQPKDNGYIKLNTNENPYPPAPAVVERIRSACNSDLRLYPDPDANDLRGKLAELFSVVPQQVIAGNGSDELLNIIIRSFAGEGEKIVYPNPTYGYYKPLIDVQGAEAVPIEFPADYSLPDELVVPDARITFLANPNGPSGTLLPYAEVAALCARVDVCRALACVPRRRRRLYPRGLGQPAVAAAALSLLLVCYWSSSSAVDGLEKPMID